METDEGPWRVVLPFQLQFDKPLASQWSGIRRRICWRWSWRIRRWCFITSIGRGYKQW
ncbi:hypothetical protein BT93_E2255 [Corymbia citriodora subsp. variegata]|nr:hypothetical protein BT93_E2255 [Corymbia citriodora subsp. variegata]